MRITSKGQVTIPRDIRDALGIVPQSEVEFVREKGRVWFDRPAHTLEQQAASVRLCINPLIYTEVSVGFDRIEDLDNALPAADFTRLSLPWQAGFLAGKAFIRYRHARGRRRSPLPDFYIGAHAAIAGIPLLTRDAACYRTYFPQCLARSELMMRTR